jgi:hypothetical protein
MKSLHRCYLMISLFSFFRIVRSIRASPYLAGMRHDVHLAVEGKRDPDL